MEHDITAAGGRIVERLRAAGHEAFFAGGCVRDLLLSLPPHDIDIATSATPRQVRRLFERTIPVGIRFGIIIVLQGERRFEVATFRADEGYTDGRRPDRVVFTTAEEDARRRDFTVNGMFYDPVEERVIDFVGGREDLARRVIRAIGDPRERFAEDYLRLLRAVRFTARLGFSLDPETASAVAERAARVATVSAERIKEELEKVLLHPSRRRGFELLEQLGLLEVVLPEVAALRGIPQPAAFHPEGDALTHTLLALDHLGEAPPPGLAWAALLHDTGKAPCLEVQDGRPTFHGHARRSAEMAEVIARRLRWSKELRETVVLLVGNHMKFIEAERMRKATLKRFLRSPRFDLQLALHRADALAARGDLSHASFCEEQRAVYERAEQLRPARRVTGRDLQALGLMPGPLFGKLLRFAEDLQLEEPELSKEGLIRRLRLAHPDLFS